MKVRLTFDVEDIDGLREWFPDDHCVFANINFNYLSGNKVKNRDIYDAFIKEAEMEVTEMKKIYES